MIKFILRILRYYGLEFSSLKRCVFHALINGNQLCKMEDAGFSLELRYANRGFWYA